MSHTLCSQFSYKAFVVRIGVNFHWKYDYHNANLVITDGIYDNYATNENKVGIMSIHNVQCYNEASLQFASFLLYHHWPLLLTWFNFNPSMDK